MLMPTVRLHLLLMRCWPSYREKCRSGGHYSARPSSQTCCRLWPRVGRRGGAGRGRAAPPPKDGPTTHSDKRTGLDRRPAGLSAAPSGGRNLPGPAGVTYVSALPAPRQPKCVAEINWPLRRPIRVECKEHLESEHRSAGGLVCRGPLGVAARLHPAPPPAC